MMPLRVKSKMSVAHENRRWACSKDPGKWLEALSARRKSSVPERFNHRPKTRPPRAADGLQTVMARPYESSILPSPNLAYNPARLCIRCRQPAKSIE